MKHRVLFVRRQRPNPIRFYGALPSENLQSDLATLRRTRKYRVAAGFHFAAPGIKPRHLSRS